MKENPDILQKAVFLIVLASLVLIAVYPHLLEKARDRQKRKCPKCNAVGNVTDKHERSVASSKEGFTGVRVRATLVCPRCLNGWDALWDEDRLD